MIRYSMWSLVMLAIGTAVTLANTAPLSPAERAGLSVIAMSQGKYQRGSKAGTIRMQFTASFKNESRAEIASIRMRLRIQQDGRTTFTSPPVTLRRFDNLGMSILGPMLPYEKTRPSDPVEFEFESRLWNTRSQLIYEIVDAQKYTGELDLHNASHLYSFIFNTPNAKAIAAMKADPSLARVRSQEGFSTTLMAFAAGDVELIRAVVALGGNVKDKTDRGAAAIHCAAISNSPANLAYAKKLGGDVNAMTAGGNTPLIRAVLRGALESVKWLLRNGANPNLYKKDRVPPAIQAIDNGQVAILHALAKAGANKTWHDSSGRGWMHAAAAGNDSMLPHVAQLGVPIEDNVRSIGTTPLMAAAEFGRPGAVIWLIRHGANPDRKDARGESAYDYSRRHNTLHTDEFFRRYVREARGK